MGLACSLGLEGWGSVVPALMVQIWGHFWLWFLNGAWNQVLRCATLKISSHLEVGHWSDGLNLNSSLQDRMLKPVGVHITNDVGRESSLRRNKVFHSAR